jgi:integrase
VRFEFEMPAGYIEEVEALTWPEFRRILLACHGLVWDEKGGRDGHGGWLTETYVDFYGTLRRRYVLADEALRRRGAVLARFLLIYCFTGTRYSQILKLRWRPSHTEPYIDFEHGEIVRDSRDGRVVTNKRRETSALLGLLFRMLERWFARDQKAGHDEYVIHKPGSAAPYVDLDYTIAQFAARAGLPHFHAHMAKHTGVTMLASKGFTSAEIAALYSTTAAVIEATYTDLGKYFQHETVAKAETRGFGAFAGFAPAPDLARLAA